jgi:hypothetical protein
MQYNLGCLFERVWTYECSVFFPGICLLLTVTAVWIYECSVSTSFEKNVNAVPKQLLRIVPPADFAIIDSFRAKTIVEMCNTKPGWEYGCENERGEGPGGKGSQPFWSVHTFRSTCDTGEAVKVTSQSRRQFIHQSMTGRESFAGDGIGRRRVGSSLNGIAVRLPRFFLVRSLDLTEREKAFQGSLSTMSYRRPCGTSQPLNKGTACYVKAHGVESWPLARSKGSCHHCGNQGIPTQFGD